MESRVVTPATKHASGCLVRQPIDNDRREVALKTSRERFHSRRFRCLVAGVDHWKAPRDGVDKVVMGDIACDKSVRARVARRRGKLSASAAADSDRLYE